MQELKVIGVESGSLLVASDEGARFRVAIDEVLQARLRQTTPDPGTGRKLAPREIQAHIRAGMSAEDVASVTGASLEYVQRFEGPILAEREYVVESALNVPVHVAVETDPLATGATFGSVIRRRLADAHAVGERWASWKEDGGGWIVKLTFVADQIERDARWGFEPKKQTLAPLNQEAMSLSQQGELPASLLPRLRAVSFDEPGEGSRFDSGAFAVTDGADTGPLLEPVVYGRVANSEAAPVRTNQTADLLEALRRRRGERDPMDPGPDDELASHTTTGVVRLIDIPLDASDEPVPVPVTVPSGDPHASRDTGARDTASRDTGPLGKNRRGRAAMPTWDEIVFGARADEDL
jgi:hypothetical protein